MTERITIDLPTPDITESDRGLRYLRDFDIYERSHADEPTIYVEGDDWPAHLVEQYALALLWMVRNHYHGGGLACEVKADSTVIDV